MRRRGAPVIGAGTPTQLAPALSVRATDVQYGVAQWPGVPAWPMTHPVSLPTNVTEVAAKSGGTWAVLGSECAAEPADGAADLGACPRLRVPPLLAGLDAWGLAAAALACGFWLTCKTEVATRGTTMTTAATAAAAAAVTAT